MSKRTVRRPTEEAALSRIMRDQRAAAKAAARVVARRVKAGEVVDEKLLALARKVFLEE